MLLETILASLVPVGIEGVKQVINKYTGGQAPAPVSVDDQIKLQNSEIDRLRALAELDNPHGTPSQWVIDLRASSRYVGALLVIVAGLLSIYTPSLPKEIVAVSLEAVGVVFGFLFGQRIVVNFKK